LRSIFYATVCAVAGTAASAQTLSVSPIPDDAESRFCYYAGLVYSEDANLTLDVPNRRQGEEAVQKRAFICTKDAASGSMKWVGIDVERQGLSGN